MGLYLTEQHGSAGRREVAYPDERFAAAMRCERFLVFDGAMGTQLQARGIDVSFSVQDLLNLDNPKLVTELLTAYAQAGCDVITTNTFRSNADILGSVDAVSEVFDAAVRCARAAGASYIAGEIGPTGQMFSPYGSLTFEHAYELFACQARAAQDAGCDFILIETFTDMVEAKAAALAAKEHTSLPVFVSMSFGENGRTMMGVTPEAFARTFSALGVDALGINCSVGPDALLPVVGRIAESCSLPVIAQPNAGLPVVVEGVTGYDMTPERFISEYRPMLDAGVSIVGSCCGTSPSYTEKLAQLVQGAVPKKRSCCLDVAATSSREVLPIDPQVLSEAVRLELEDTLDAAAVTGAYFSAMSTEAKLYAIDVTGAAPEAAAEAITALQGVCTAPLWISSEDERAVEAAVRVHAGCPVIGVQGAAHSGLMESIAHHYGCVLV